MYELHDKYPNYNYIICGDLNIDFQKNDNDKSSLENIFKMFDLTSTIKGPTRINKSSATQIDYIITNIKTEYETSILELGISDHTAQVINFNSYNDQQNNQVKISKRSFTDMNKHNYTNLLINIDWSELYSIDDVNLAYEFFEHKIKICFDLAFPSRNIKTQSSLKKPWITRGIKISCKNKRFLILMKNYTQNLFILNYIKKYCRILKQTINTSKQNYYNNKIKLSTNKIKTTWNCINENTNKKREQKPEKIILKTNHNVTIEDAKMVAQNFQQYFLDEPINLTNNLTSIKTSNDYIKNCVFSTHNSFHFYPLVEQDIVRIVKRLKTKETAGYDELPITLIKENINLLKKPLTFITNLSFTTGTFPDNLKIAKIIPIYKKGEKAIISNYRPISVLPSVSKIIELAVKEQIVSYLDIKKILTAAQFGFREGRNTTDAIYSLINNINNCLESKCHPLCIFCDLTKAFDCVDHQYLLEKLYFYGFRGVSYEWFQSYLHNRKMYVELKDIVDNELVPVRTDRKIMKCGVPQGSILGPVLFLLYINDLVYNFTMVQFSLFADDTSLLFKNPSPECTEILNNLNDWFSANKLILNLSKTHCITFHPGYNYTQQDLHLNLGTISSVEDVKFLGVYLDESLKWKRHLVELNNRLSSAVYAIFIIRKNVGFQTSLTVYYAYFQSILQYGIEFWGDSTGVAATFRIQKKAIRSICCLRPRDSCREHFKKLRIMTLVNLYLFRVSIIIFRNKTSLIKHSDNHNYDTRQNNLYLLPQYNYNVTRKSTFYNGIKIFNHLPSNIKNIMSLNQFKRKLRHLLLNKVFYTLEEYFTFCF